MTDLLLALPLGILIGLSLGALGAGGSILTVPALVLVLGQTPHEAASTSLIVVGITAAAAAVGHHRRGAVRLRAGSLFALAGVAGSLLGTFASVHTDPDALALAFATIMLVAATFMWRSVTTTAEQNSDADAPTHPIPRTFAAGSTVGLLTGFFGIGGGFLAVPALTYALGLRITTAVGTSLLVIALNSTTALAPRIADGLIDPAVTTTFVAGGLLGGAIGTRVAHRTDPARLKRAFAILVVITAFALSVDTLIS